MSTIKPFFFCCIVIIVFAVSFIAETSKAQQPIGYSTRDVISGLNVPWEVCWGPDNWIWFTERIGTINRLNPETSERELLLIEGDVSQVHESGMLGLDFHPNFPDSPYVFAVFTYIDSVTDFWKHPTYMKVVRYTYTGDSLIDRITIYDKIHGKYAHNGSRIIVTDDRKIFVTTGENYDTPQWAQMDSLPNGKILRLNIDGSIPDDNPWHGSPAWTKGHRNAQGLCFGPTGILYSSEHGDFTDDEINIIRPKQNYGWPIVAGYCDSANEMTFCQDSNVAVPLYAWTPTVAVCGIEFDTSDLYPDLQNSLLVATLKDQTLRILQMDSAGENVLNTLSYWMWMTSDAPRHAGRLRDVCITPSGRIFISTSNSTVDETHIDRIFEFIPNNIKGVQQPQTRAAARLLSNPAHDDITITNLPSIPATLELVDVLGKRIYHSRTSSPERTIHVRSLARGSYYIRISAGTMTQTIPVMIH